MSAPQTSIINPLNDNEILLFYLDGKGSTALDRHNFANNKYTASVFDDNGISAGADFVANPGSFTSLTANGLLSVFGLVREPAAKPPASGDAGSGAKLDDASATKRIAQLSPVYKLISGDPTLGKANGIALASTIDNVGQAWLYNITVKNNSPAINEIKLGWDKSVQGSVIAQGQPLLATNLAATYDTKTNKKLIIYQNAKTLRIIDSAGNSDAEVPNTSDSLDSTGLALVTVKTTLGLRLYLYYFSNKGTNLQRVIRKEDGTWKDSVEVTGANAGEKTTFLSATQVGNTIAVFYITPDDKKAFYVYQDTITQD